MSMRIVNPTHTAIRDTMGAKRSTVCVEIICESISMPHAAQNFASQRFMCRHMELSQLAIGAL